MQIHVVLHRMRVFLYVNKKKTQFLVFHRDGARDIQVGTVCVQESKSAVLLGMTMNKNWTGLTMWQHWKKNLSSGP
jgi:hypothetical protein